MKNEQLFEALGEIDENYINNALKPGKKRTGMRFTKSTWLKFASIAACFGLMVWAVVFVLNNDMAWGPTHDDETDYGNTISYVVCTDNAALYEGALNNEFFPNEQNVHLPIFKIDTFEELEGFKATYENTVTMDQGYDTVLSFNAAMSKAQWDREIFYENNSLLIIYIPASSGSFRYAIQEIEISDKSICIRVERVNESKVITEDMAGWFLLVEVEDEEISKYISFDAILDG